MTGWQRISIFFGATMVVNLLPINAFADDPAYPALAAPAQEVAKDIGVAPYIVELRALHAQKPDPKAIRTDLEYLYAKQQMTEILLTTFLQTRDIVADVDDEMLRATELKNLLESRRDRAIRLNNITNFTSGGALAMIGSGIQVGGGNAINNAGNVMEVAAGALSTGISTYALKQSSGERRSAGVSPNLLARLFNLTPAPEKDIPLPIWNFLNSPMPGVNGSTRLSSLIDRWVQSGRLPPLKSKDAQRRLALLCGTMAQRHEVTIDLLESRIAMLNDLRAAIGAMNRQLVEIMQLMRTL